MKILIVDLAIGFGGANTRTLGLLKIIPSANIELAAIENSPVFLRAKEQGATCHSVGKIKTSLSIAKKIRKLIFERDITVLDCQNSQAKFWSFLAVLNTNCALVSTLNSWYLNEHSNSLRGYFYHFLELLSAKRTDFYITVSEEISASLARQGKISSQYHIGLNAVFPSAQLNDLKKLELKKKYLTAEQEYVAVSVGRLVSAKGYSYMIDALPLMNEKIHWLVVGTGDLQENLLKQANDKGVSDRITWCGELDSEGVSEVLQLADIYVLSSITEGMPFSLLEAAATTLPIVATKVGDIPKAITNNIEGKLVEARDYQALASNINWMYANQDEAVEMGKNAQEMIKEKYSPVKMADLANEAYERALENRLKQ